MSVPAFDWFVDRLDLASWQSEEPGRRSGFFACPVHGGSDSLHVTEKNGKALITCFACGADIFAVTEQLEKLEVSDDEDDEEDGDVTPSVTITRTRGGARKPGGGSAADNRRERGVRLPAASITGESPSGKARGSGPRTAGSSPASPAISPLDWMAARCALERSELDALGLPLSEQGSYLIFEFEGVEAQKLRGVGEGKKGKDFRWRGASAPPFWPVPTGSAEVVICEGEADAICLRASGLDAYSITKGSQGEVPAPAWEALRAHGTESVKLVFDMDDAGRKGRKSAASGARDAGLNVRESRVAGINVLAGEKDARDVALRQGYPLELEDDADEDLPVLLEDIVPVEPKPMLLDRLHADEHTILYGDGSTGKGVIAAWWVARLTRQNMRVLILDYEMHANFEWRPRVARFGGDLSRVAILQPTRPIWDIAGWLGSQAAAYDYVVIDSVAYACVGAEVEKSPTAIQYSQAIGVLGKPVLSIAHVTKEDADPKHPFGSIFWSNGARVTIAVSRRDPDDPESPRVLRNAKTNQRAPFRPVAIDWSWLGNDEVGCDCNKQAHPHLHEVAAYTNAAQAARDLHAQLGRNPTVDEMQELGFDTNDNAIRQAIFKGKVPTVTRTRKTASGHD